MAAKVNIFKTDSIFKVLAVILVILIVIFRAAFIFRSSSDIEVYFEPWYDHIKMFGPLEAFGYQFSNYPPLYSHILSFFTLLPLEKIAAFKLMNLPFELLAAFFTFKIFRLRLTVYRALCGALFFLLIPTLILNAYWWGQSDMFFSSMLIGAVYFLMVNQKQKALMLFALSFCFKLQSVFFILPVLVCLLEKPRITFYLLLVPVFYLLTCIPSLLYGRDLASLTGIYFAQTQWGSALDINFPGVYWLFFDAERTASSVASNTGTVFTGLLIFYLAWRLYRLKDKQDPYFYLKVSLLSAIVIPYFLPGMHDRYFFLAELLAFILAFLDFKKYFFVPVILISCSLLSYIYYLARVNFSVYWLEAAVLLILVVYLILDIGRFLNNPRSESRLKV